MGVADRYWTPITPQEAERVLGRPVEIVSGHLRWLFAVASPRWAARLSSCAGSTG